MRGGWSARLCRHSRIEHLDSPPDSPFSPTPFSRNLRIDRGVTLARLLAARTIKEGEKCTALPSSGPRPEELLHLQGRQLPDDGHVDELVQAGSLGCRQSLLKTVSVIGECVAPATQFRVQRPITKNYRAFPRSRRRMSSAMGSAQISAAMLAGKRPSSRKARSMMDSPSSRSSSNLLNTAAIPISIATVDFSIPQRSPLPRTP